MVFDNFDGGVVSAGPIEPTTFRLRQSAYISVIRTYDWNSGRGAAPGTIRVESRDGRAFGPWRATGVSGQGGVRNEYWVVNPNVTLPPGTYTIIDSDPRTWAQNSGSDNQGMAQVEGAQSPAAVSPAAAEATESIHRRVAERMSRAFSTDKSMGRGRPACPHSFELWPTANRRGTVDRAVSATRPGSARTVWCRR